MAGEVEAVPVSAPPSRPVVPVAPRPVPGPAVDGARGVHPADRIGTDVVVRVGTAARYRVDTAEPSGAGLVGPGTHQDGATRVVRCPLALAEPAVAAGDRGGPGGGAGRPRLFSRCVGGRARFRHPPPAAAPG